MSEKKKYNFGEKEKEYSVKHSKELPVWKSPKYEEAKRKVIEMLESEEYKDVLSESDFWILMNTTKTEKMQYTGLIISHNGCLKINDTLSEEMKFNPICMKHYYDENMASLVFEYNSSVLENDKQKIYEIGEVSTKNCSNDYPFAMALKRCMDRVILKNSKLAYSGVYSDSEAEEFKEPEQEEEIKFIQATDKQLSLIKSMYEDRVEEINQILGKLGKKKITELSVQEASNIIANGNK